MENMENKILEVLNDPEKMSEILQIAKGMGFDPEQMSQPAEDAGGIPTGELFRLLQQTNSTDTRQQALLQALMPYLKPERQKKLQRAMQVARLTHLAGYALKNYTDTP